MSNADLEVRFINGLKKYNLTADEIRNKWEYCGGDSDKHLNYYKLRYPGEELLEHVDFCVCGRHITRNSYITCNEEEYLVLGICCIKKFVKMSGKTCCICKEDHRNRACNMCNECRVGRCEICTVACLPCYKKCWAHKDTKR
jgi:hypothetical protein